MLGFFKIEYPVALMSVSCFNEFAETVLGDKHSRQLFKFKLFKKLKKASLANVFQEQVHKSLNEGHVPSYLQLFIFSLFWISQQPHYSWWKLIGRTHLPEIPVGKAFGLSRAHQCIFSSVAANLRLMWYCTSVGTSLDEVMIIQVPKYDFWGPISQCPLGNPQKLCGPTM